MIDTLLTTIIGKDELARLQKIEEAAKKLAKCNITYDRTDNVRVCFACSGDGFGLDKVKHNPTCPVLVINPIGDTK